MCSNFIHATNDTTTTPNCQLEDWKKFKALILSSGLQWSILHRPPDTIKCTQSKLSFCSNKVHVHEHKNACRWENLSAQNTRTTCLISWVSDTWQRENIGFPRVQLSDDVYTHLLHRRIQVHHLVSDSQLMNKFLHARQYTDVPIPVDLRTAYC